MTGQTKKTKKSPPKTVGLDSMSMIWGLQQRPVPEEKTEQAREMRIRSRILLEILSEENARVVVPTVVVAELLIPVAPVDRAPFLAVLNERFNCPPFDLPAATIAAELWQFHKSLPKDEQYKDRPLLKLDLLIVASAKAAGATEFYSHDAKCRKLAQQIMLAKDLRKHHPNMFRDKELKLGQF